MNYFAKIKARLSVCAFMEIKLNNYDAFSEKKLLNNGFSSTKPCKISKSQKKSKHIIYLIICQNE